MSSGCFESYEVLSSTLLSISTGHDGYPSEPPYSASTAYPEYPFDYKTLVNENNHAYDRVSDALQLLNETVIAILDHYIYKDKIGSEKN